MLLHEQCTVFGLFLINKRLQKKGILLTELNKLLVQVALKDERQSQTLVLKVSTEIFLILIMSACKLHLTLCDYSASV